MANIDWNIFIHVWYIAKLLKFINPSYIKLLLHTWFAKGMGVCTSHEISHFCYIV